VASASATGSIRLTSAPSPGPTTPRAVALDVGLAVDGRAEDPAVPGDGLLCPAAADGEVDVNATGRIPVQKRLGDLYDATR
jgi:hypothetical protein